jgi:hypothetical protein
VEETELARSGAAGVVREGKDERNGSNGSGWVYTRIDRIVKGKY